MERLRSSTSTMHSINTIDMLYILTLLWSALYPVLRGLLPVFASTLLSRFVFQMKFRALLHEPCVVRLLSKSVFSTNDHPDFPICKDIITRYPHGLFSLIKIDEKYALVYVAPSPKLSDKNDIYLRELTIYCYSKHEADFVKVLNETNPKNVIKTNTTSVSYVNGSRQVSSATNKEIINQPGLGCNKDVFNTIRNTLNRLDRNAELMRSRNLPAGEVMLLVGPPGTGKSSVVSHASICSGVSEIRCLIPQTSTSLPLGIRLHLVESETFKLITTTDFAYYKHVSTHVVVINDIDRLLQSNIVSTSEIINVLDDLLQQACLVVFTANSITPFDAALLSRFKTLYVKYPDAYQLTDIVKLYHDDIADETVTSWVNEIVDEVKDLRLLRRCLVSMSAGETLPQAWRRIYDEETAARERANLDGDKYVTT